MKIGGGAITCLTGESMLQRGEDGGSGPRGGKAAYVAAEVREGRLVYQWVPTRRLNLFGTVRYCWDNFSFITCEHVPLIISCCPGIWM